MFIMKQQNISQKCEAISIEERLPYHAPQIRVHGKLERLTLTGGSNGVGGGGAGNPPGQTED